MPFVTGGFIRTTRTEQTRDAFLEMLTEEGSVVAACKRLGLHRPSMYAWRDDDKEFAEAWQAALGLGVDAIEDEAIRRAKEGVEHKVYYKGEPVGSYQEYSDQLMMFFLRAAKPEKYGNRSEVHLTGAVALESLIMRAIDSPPAELEGPVIDHEPAAKGDG